MASFIQLNQPFELNRVIPLKTRHFQPVGDFYESLIYIPSGNIARVNFNDPQGRIETSSFVVADYKGQEGNREPFTELRQCYCKAVGECLLGKWHGDNCEVPLKLYSGSTSQSKQLEIGLMWRARYSQLLEIVPAVLQQFLGKMMEEARLDVKSLLDY